MARRNRCRRRKRKGSFKRKEELESALQECRVLFRKESVCQERIIF